MPPPRLPDTTPVPAPDPHAQRGADRPRESRPGLGKARPGLPLQATKAEAPGPRPGTPRAPTQKGSVPAMRHNLNNRGGSGDLSNQADRAMFIIGQLKELFRSIADVHTVNLAQIHARQGLDLIATLDRLNAADPDLPKQRDRELVGCTQGCDAELLIEQYRAETGAPWGGGI